jgi:hypothetical protein
VRRPGPETRSPALMQSKSPRGQPDGPSPLHARDGSYSRWCRSSPPEGAGDHPRHPLVLPRGRLATGSDVRRSTSSEAPAWSPRPEAAAPALLLRRASRRGPRRTRNARQASPAATGRHALPGRGPGLMATAATASRVAETGARTRRSESRRCVGNVPRTNSCLRAAPTCGGGALGFTREHKGAVLAAVQSKAQAGVTHASPTLARPTRGLRAAEGGLVLARRSGGPGSCCGLVDPSRPKEAGHF